MPVPIEKGEMSGALLVAAGLVIGGLITYVADRFDLRTPGLISRRPPAIEFEGLSGRVGVGEEASVTPNGVARSNAKDSVGGGGGASRNTASRPVAGEGVAGGRVGGPEAYESDIRKERLAPIEINTATTEELRQLDGIGPALAARIAEFRGKNGPFRRMEDLLLVKGIGPATLSRIKSGAILGGGGDGSQNTFLISTSSQEDSSSFQR
jgi:competence ComEA-like helix-hairpin-helix protein